MLTEASADDPIYKRGFAIGGQHSTPKPDAKSKSPGACPPFEAVAHRSVSAQTSASSSGVSDMRQGQEFYFLRGLGLGRLGRRDLSTRCGMSAFMSSMDCAYGEAFANLNA